MIYTNINEGDTLKKKVMLGSGLILLVIIVIVLILFIVNSIIGTNKKIELKIKTLNNLKVSADGIDYFNELTKENFNIASNVYSNENQLPNVLSRISTNGAVSDGKLDLYYETIKNKDNNYYVSSEKQKDEKCFNNECKNKYYLTFDLFFNSDTPETIVLTKNSYVKQKKDKGMENAIRVAFIVEGTTNSKDTDDIQGLEAGIKAVIWEPNCEDHSKKAINFVRDVYNEELDGQLSYYRGINSTFSGMNIKDIEDSEKYSNVSSSIATTKEFDSSQELFNIQQGTTKVRVYVWFESGDRDSMFETKVSNLDINLELEIK